VSSGFGELTTQANELVAAGDLSGAHELLADALAGTDPRPGTASPELADAAGLQARILVALADPYSARGWAAFAHSAATRLHGRADPRTVGAAATLAAVLHRVGSHQRAARLYRDVIIELTATDGPESLRVLAAHADLATVEFALGECEAARTRLEDAWELHREVYGDGHLSGIKMLARLGAMQRDCGHGSEAHDHLALARELCRAHLAADHPLAIQVAALARAAPDPDHVCAEPAPAAPDDPAAFAPPAAPPVPEPPPVTYPPPPAAAFAPPPVPAPPPTFATPPAPAPPAVPTQRVYRDQAPPHPARSDDDLFRYPDDPDEYPDDPGADDRWWPPDVAEPEGDGDPAAAPGTVGPGAADPPPPAPPAPPYALGAGNAVELPAYRSGGYDESDGVRRVRHLPERRSPAGLPAVYQPPRRRRMLPIIVAGLVVAVLGAAAVVAGFVRVGSPETPTRSSSPSHSAAGSVAPGVTGSGTPRAGSTPSGSPAPGTPPGPAPPGAPPGGLTLRDNRDSVTLAWTYPAAAEGPVIVSGGRSGQEPRAFQELPAGTRSYIVYGLNKSLNYCFTVAVVYSADVVGRAKPVCTARRSGSTAG
jgi:hypothetical protein